MSEVKKVSNESFASKMTQIADEVNKKAADKFLDAMIEGLKEDIKSKAENGFYSMSINAEHPGSYQPLFDQKTYHKYIKNKFIDKVEELGFKITYNPGDYNEYEHFDISFNDNSELK